jgi:phosphoglycerate dehydrogenase-like enzyme
VNQVVWCQWSDIFVPQGWKLISAPVDTLRNSDFAEITIYIPTYMGGKKSLDPISDLTNLKTVQLLTAGYEDVIPFMRDELTLCNARGVHDFSTSELAVSLILAHYKDHREFAQSQSQGSWNHKTTGSTYGKEIAIIGAGSVAQRLKSMLAPFECKVTMFGQSARDGVEAISTAQATVGKFDCVVLLVPLTASTQNLVDAAFLKAMKDGALLVNVARGPVVNTDALCAELASKRLFAALDVTDPEPLTNGHPLWSYENCTVIPHVGGDSTAFEPQARAFLAEQFKRIAQGMQPINIIDWKNQ